MRGGTNCTELIDASAECGDGSALVWGGNPEVGCGEGVPGLPGDVYPNNQVIVAPTVCVSEEDSLVLVHRDGYRRRIAIFHCPFWKRGLCLRRHRWGKRLGVSTRGHFWGFALFGRDHLCRQRQLGRQHERRNGVAQRTRASRTGMRHVWRMV